jgi:hypothetical protein
VRAPAAARSRFGTADGQLCAFLHPAVRLAGVVSAVLKRWLRRVEVLWMRGTGAVVGKVSVCTS